MSFFHFPSTKKHFPNEDRWISFDIARGTAVILMVAFHIIFDLRYFFGYDYVGDLSSLQAKEGEVRSFRWVREDELHKYLLFENQLEDTLGKIGEMFGTTVVSLAGDTTGEKKKVAKYG